MCQLQGKNNSELNHSFNIKINLYQESVLALQIHAYYSPKKRKHKYQFLKMNDKFFTSKLVPVPTPKPGS